MKRSILSRIQMKGITAGDELRKLRNEVCYSQEYMAKRLGITQSTYQRIEAGEIKILWNGLLELKKFLASPRWILSVLMQMI